MKYYITKYALTDGIITVGDKTTHRRDSEGWLWKNSDGQPFLQSEWKPTPKAALADAEKRRAAKIASLAKQIEQLNSLTFEIKEV